jgi:hypothetical protein
VASSDALARRQRLYRAWVWASVVLAPIAFLTALASLGRSSPSPNLVGGVGRAVATVALQSWLASKPPPLPAGRIVEWDGSSVVGPSGGQPGWRAVQERFVVLSRGQMWEATVEVALIGGSAAVVGGGPYVEAAPAPAAAPATGPWPGLNASGFAPSLVVAAIDGWARAYCSGDPAELRLAIGDNDPAHVYSPLSGVDGERVQIAWYANLPHSSSAVAQVDLYVRWRGEKTMPTRPIVLDLLVTRAIGLAPLVVSWGPPGSGPSLRTYEPV